MANLKEILTTLTVSKIVEGQKMVSAKEGDTILAVAEILRDNKISSVPVFKDDNCVIDNCIGIVDHSDISNALIELLSKGFSKNNPRRNIWQKFSSMPVKEAIKFNASKYVQIEVDRPILDVVENTAEFAFRRMIAVDTDSQVVGIVSPSELCKHVLDAIGKHDNKVLSSTLSELNIGSPTVLSVKKSESVNKAFKLMADEMISAVAVVDNKTGVLTANMSASDISMVIETKASELLNASVWKFVTEKKAKEIDAVYPYFSVLETSTLKVTIERILATQVHHLYIVDKENKPLRVVGFSDLFRGLLAYKRLE